jgi:hypothetical protein
VLALPVHDFVGVSEIGAEIGAATGGGPYKRMKQPWGEMEMGREGLDFGWERLTKYFYFFLPKSLIFPATTSISF